MPLSLARGHPSCSDPIKIHSKGKKGVGQRVRGEKRCCDAASSLCAASLRGLAGKMKGACALFSGPGRPSVMGGSVGRRNADGMHASISGPSAGICTLRRSCLGTQMLLSCPQTRAVLCTP